MALSSVVGRGAPLLPWSPGLGCVPSADEVCGVGVQVGVRCRASPNHRPPWHSIFALSLDTIVLIHCRLYQTTSHHAHSPSRSSAWSACPRQPSHRRCLRRGTLLAATPCRQPIRPTALSPALPPPDQEPSRVSHGLTHPPDGLSVTCFAPYCPCHLPAITPLPRAPRRRYNPCVTGLVSRTIYAVRRAAPAWVPLHPPHFVYSLFLEVPPPMTTQHGGELVIGHLPIGLGAPRLHGWVCTIPRVYPSSYSDAPTGVEGAESACACA